MKVSEPVHVGILVQLELPVSHSFVVNISLYQIHQDLAGSPVKSMFYLSPRHIEELQRKDLDASNDKGLEASLKWGLHAMAIGVVQGLCRAKAGVLPIRPAVCQPKS